MSGLWRSYCATVSSVSSSTLFCGATGVGCLSDIKKLINPPIAIPAAMIPIRAFIASSLHPPGDLGLGQRLLQLGVLAAGRPQQVRHPHGLAGVGGEEGG